MNTVLKDKLYNITFTLHDLTHKPISNLYYEIKNGKELVKKGNTNGQGEISLKYVGGNTLTVFVRKDADKTMKKIGEIHTPSKSIKVKLISPKMKFDVTLLPHQEQGKYWRGTYKVKSGDTLSKIAKEHHTTVSALLALNPFIKSPDRINANENIKLGDGNKNAIIKLNENQSINLPSNGINSENKKYRVRKGDTLSKIAKQNNITISQLLAINPLINSADKIYINDEINLNENTVIKIPPTKETGKVAVDRKSQPSVESTKLDTKNNEVTTKIDQPQPSGKVQTVELQQESNEDKKPVAVVSLKDCVCQDYDLIWGGKVDCIFRRKVVEISKELWGDSKKIDMANMLMAVFAWESGETFAVDVPNMQNSGGTGLIQIMPSTYQSLTGKKPTLVSTKKYFGKTLTVIKELSSLTPVQYLDIVKQYFLPLKGKSVEFIDFYLQVLFPASSGKKEHTVFAKNEGLLDVSDHKEERVSKFERNNMDGYYLDKNGVLKKDGVKDGRVMKSEIAAAIEHYKTDGLNHKSDYKSGCSIKPVVEKVKSKKIIVIDPGHGIEGGNVGTGIRLLKMKATFGDNSFKIGQTYSWQDLPDKIINQADKYFEFIDVSDSRSPSEAKYVFDRSLELKKLLEEAGHHVILTRDIRDTIKANLIPNISSAKKYKITSTSPINYRVQIAKAAKADYFISLHCDGASNLTANFAAMCYSDENGKSLADKVIEKYSLIKGKASKRTDLGVLKNSAKYNLLIEIGFMTTPSHMKILLESYSILMNDIFLGISEHLNENK